MSDMVTVRRTGPQIDSHPTADYAQCLGIAVTDLLTWMSANGIPFSAKLAYAGCGTHEILFVWEEADDASRGGA